MALVIHKVKLNEKKNSESSTAIVNLCFAIFTSQSQWVREGETALMCIDFIFNLWLSIFVCKAIVKVFHSYSISSQFLTIEEWACLCSLLLFASDVSISRGTCENKVKNESAPKWARDKLDIRFITKKKQQNLVWMICTHFGNVCVAIKKIEISACCWFAFRVG